MNGRLCALPTGWWPVCVCVCVSSCLKKNNYRACGSVCLFLSQLPEQYRLMHIQPPKKKSKHKHKHHRPQDPLPQGIGHPPNRCTHTNQCLNDAFFIWNFCNAAETPSDTDPKKKKKKRDDDPDRKKKKKDKKKKKVRNIITYIRKHLKYMPFFPPTINLHLKSLNFPQKLALHLVFRCTLCTDGSRLFS